MENSVEDKRAMDNFSDGSSPRKVRKIDQNQEVQIPLSPSTDPNVTEYDSPNPRSIGDKMSNIAKLRQQFVKEIKDVELSLKETIKDLKSKISRANTKSDFLTNKLRQTNKLLCDQSKTIYKKEQENKILCEKVEELYENQKIIFEDMEDISNTLNNHKSLSDRLTNEYDSIILMQLNDTKMLEEELNKIVPDEKFVQELNEINLEIDQREKENVQCQNIISQLETELKTVKIKKEEQQKYIAEQNKTINELEVKNETSKQKAEKEKNNLLGDIEKLKQEAIRQVEEISELDKNISQLNSKLEIKRSNQKENEKRMKEINEEIEFLLEESKQLDKIQCEDDAKNKDTLEKLNNQLKSSQAELNSVKEQQDQAINLLQKKNLELRAKLKSYESVEPKLKKLEIEKKKEEESIALLIKTIENKKNNYCNAITVVEKKIGEYKTKINEIELNCSDTEKTIELLEKEIFELNETYETELNKSNEEKSQKKSIDHYSLSNLFEEIENTKKQTIRKTLYTPTLADDDLKEIDSLSLDEQYTQLTQSYPSRSPEKTNKFFKRSSLSQLKNKKESTPRGRPRSKKN